MATHCHPSQSLPANYFWEGRAWCHSLQSLNRRSPESQRKRRRNRRRRRRKREGGGVSTPLHLLLHGDNELSVSHSLQLQQPIKHLNPACVYVCVCACVLVEGVNPPSNLSCLYNPPSVDPSPRQTLLIGAWPVPSSKHTHTHTLTRTHPQSHHSWF